MSSIPSTTVNSPLQIGGFNQLTTNSFPVNNSISTQHILHPMVRANYFAPANFGEYDSSLHGSKRGPILKSIMRVLP